MKLYEEDYQLWLEKTINQLKNRDLEHIDWHNLIEELEDLSNRNKREVKSYLIQLLIHLLLYQYWNSERNYSGRGWKVEIANFRDELSELLDSKTLYNYMLQILPNAYQKARKRVIIKSDLHNIPELCPYKIEEILAENWLPEAQKS
jgi:hypothetical protein